MLLTFLATVCLTCFGGGGGGAGCGGATGDITELRPLFLVCRVCGGGGGAAVFFTGGGGNWVPVAGDMVPTMRPILGSITNW